MTTELVLAELLCCDCVFCNSLVFYVSTFYFILWAVVSAAYLALLSISSYFERINDDDDDDYIFGTVQDKMKQISSKRYQNFWEQRLGYSFYVAVKYFFVN